MNCNECEKNCLICEGIDNDLRLKIAGIIKKVSDKGKEKSLSKQLEEVIKNFGGSTRNSENFFSKSDNSISIIIQLQSDYSFGRVENNGGENKMKCGECEKKCLECEIIDNNLRREIREIIGKIPQQIQSCREEPLYLQLSEAIENLPYTIQQKIENIFWNEFWKTT